MCNSSLTPSSGSQRLPEAYTKIATKCSVLIFLNAMCPKMMFIAFTECYDSGNSVSATVKALLTVMTFETNIDVAPRRKVLKPPYHLPPIMQIPKLLSNVKQWIRNCALNSLQSFAVLYTIKIWKEFISFPPEPVEKCHSLFNAFPRPKVV